MKLSCCTYLDLGKTIFLFFDIVMTAVATPTPGSYHWGGDYGRATETSTVEDARSGDARAS
jgi:hypothetical protein